jgi:hypothetical protein
VRGHSGSRVRSDLYKKQSRIFVQKNHEAGFPNQVRMVCGNWEGGLWTVGSGKWEVGCGGGGLEEVWIFMRGKRGEEGCGREGGRDRSFVVSLDFVVILYFVATEIFIPSSLRISLLDFPNLSTNLSFLLSSCFMNPS